MADIKTHLNNIKGALYGKDVRGSIHDGIDAINKEVENTTGRQVDLESTFDQLVINAGNSNAEIVDARVKNNGTSYSKLGDRLDAVDSQLAHIAHQLNTNDDTGLTEVLEKVKDGDSIYLNNFELFYFKNNHTIPKGVKLYSNGTCIKLEGEIKCKGDNIIEGIVFDGEYKGGGLNILGDNVTVNKCNFLNTKKQSGLTYAINSENCTNINIANCIFDGLQPSNENGVSGDSEGAIRAIRIFNCDFVNIENNIFKNMVGFEDGDYIHILANSTADSQNIFPYGDLYFDRNENIKIYNNYFEQKQNKSCIKTQCGGVEMYNNRFYIDINDSKGYSCVRIQGGEGLIVKNNTFNSVGNKLTTGILVEYTNNVQISNNNITVDKTVFAATDTASIVQIQHSKNINVYSNDITTSDVRDIFRCNSNEDVNIVDNIIKINTVDVGTTIIKTINTYSKVSSYITFSRNNCIIDNPKGKQLFEVDNVENLYIKQNTIHNIISSPFSFKNSNKVEIDDNKLYINNSYKTPFYPIFIYENCGEFIVSDNFIDLPVTVLIRIDEPMTSLLLKGNYVDLLSNLFYNNTGGTMDNSVITYVQLGKKYGGLDYGGNISVLTCKIQIGHVFFNTSTKSISIWNGSEWV